MSENSVHPEFFNYLADIANDAIMPHFRRIAVVTNKADDAFDPVTVADKSAERAMRALIAAHYKEHGILGEEHGAERLDAEYVWVLDPIDGTRAFITGLPTWGVLIGLQQNGHAVQGMMAQPFTGERYWGNGSIARYTGPGGPRDLTCRPCPTLAQATILTTTPALFNADERARYDKIEAEAQLARYGLDCYGYCMVAAGTADAVIETGLQAYDIVALIPIIEGAGGRVTNWQGNRAEAGGQILATGDPQLHDLLLTRLNS